MDTVSKEKRSKIMSAIHSRDTLPEVVVRKMLWENGYRFRVCDKRIVGHPDIVIPKCRALIEVRGCFWHQHGWEWNGRKLVQTSICPTATRPKSNCEFWDAKFRRSRHGGEMTWRARLRGASAADFGIMCGHGRSG